MKIKTLVIVWIIILWMAAVFISGLTQRISAFLKSNQSFIQYFIVNPAKDGWETFLYRDGYGILAILLWVTAYLSSEWIVRRMKSCPLVGSILATVLWIPGFMSLGRVPTFDPETDKRSTIFEEFCTTAPGIILLVVFVAVWLYWARRLEDSDRSP